MNAPYPGFAGTSPRGGRFALFDLPPLGEVARSAEGGLVLEFSSPNPTATPKRSSPPWPAGDGLRHGRGRRLGSRCRRGFGCGRHPMPDIGRFRRSSWRCSHSRDPCRRSRPPSAPCRPWFHPQTERRNGRFPARALRGLGRAWAGQSAAGGRGLDRRPAGHFGYWSGK